MSTPRRVALASALENEINVTPMIDVLLVLLIIFMAAIPSMRKSIDVQVPDRTSRAAEGKPSIVLEIDAAGAYAINGDVVAAMDVARGAGVKVLGIEGGHTLPIALYRDDRDSSTRCDRSE